MSETREAGIARISAAMGRFRLLIGRRIISRLALNRTAPMLELSDLDVLSLVPGTGPKSRRYALAEPSVGEIARQLRIDPSRASRLVARLVEQGYLVRTVAQEDARRAVLQRSDRGDQIFAEIQSLKTELIAEALTEWPEDQLTAFAASFDRFTVALEDQLSSRQAEESD